MELQIKKPRQKNLKNKDLQDPLSLKPFLSKLGVRYLGIINKQGRLEEEVIVSANDFDLSAEQKEMFFMTLRLQASMQNDFDDMLGSVWYNLIVRKNIKFLSMPIYNNHNGGLLFATMGKEADHFAFMKNAQFLSCYLEKDEQRVVNRVINHGRGGWTL